VQGTIKETAESIFENFVLLNRKAAMLKSCFVTMLVLSFVLLWTPNTVTAQTTDTSEQVIRIATTYRITPNITYHSANNWESKLDVYRPGDITTPRPTLIYIHGGGWVIGRAHLQDSVLEEIMEDCNAVVISVDYRTAPENPYPAAQDDCEAVAMWAIENAPKEFGTDNIVIGGESAGAHLSAETMIRMRDKHGYTGFSGANLAYGVFDLSMTPSVRLWGARNLILSTPIMRWFIDHYVPDESIRRDPDVSPLYANLHDLSTALFSVGTLDPLLDDTLFMHSRWFASGNPSTLNVYPGATHGFEKQPTQLADIVRGRMRRFITEGFRS